MAMLADYIPGPKISILEEAFSKNLLGTFLLVRAFEISYILPFSISRY